MESYRLLCPSVPCRVIPNGIDAELYRPETLNTNVLDLPPEAKVILFLGRLHPIKGAIKLIEAFIQVCNHVSDVILVMAGPDEFMIEDKFRSIVAQSNLQNRIVFPGMVTGELKRDLLARADLFCLPSTAEGFSMAILESLASGTAVMISPGCHFPEVEKADVGKVVAAEPEMMAIALLELLQNKARLKEMGLRGRDFVAQNYTWDVVADMTIDMYREGMARHALAFR
jgi:glycosyltransferase involved in cell wall biosynthesis